MIIIAASLYLPEHVTTIANRVFYYWRGDEAQDGASKAAQQIVATSSRVVREAATSLLGKEGLRQGEQALRGNGRGYMEL